MTVLDDLRHPLPADQRCGDTQTALVGGNSSTGVDQCRGDAHGSLVVVGDSQPAPKGVTNPMATPGLADALLLIYADALDDLERVRIATENRARSLAQVKGLDGSPEQNRMLGMVDGIAAMEHDAALQLKRELRKHPLGPWVKRTIGVGEKQGARLIAAIGDPYWHSQQDRPRTVSELWAYCGYHVLRTGQSTFDTHSGAADADHSSDPGQSSAGIQTSNAGVAPSRQRGQKANWNGAAKMRAFLVAESCIKQRRSPYRKVYDDGRARYADAVHPADCRRCGPSGKPALVGSPLNDGHKHARAMRLVAKAILKDLWLEAKALREGGAA